MLSIGLKPKSATFFGLKLCALLRKKCESREMGRSTGSGAAVVRGARPTSPATSTHRVDKSVGGNAGRENCRGGGDDFPPRREFCDT